MTRLLLALAACQATDPVPTGPPAMAEVTRVVVVGDNGGASPSAAQGWPALLAVNEDDLFPDFAGEDLAAARPGTTLLRLHTAGESYGRLARGESTVCTCEADCPADPCLDLSDPAPTLIIVQLGVNDLLTLALRLLSDATLRADPQPAIDALAADVATVLRSLAEPASGRPPRLLVLDVPDPSDGVGDLAELVATLFPIAGTEAVDAALALTVIEGVHHALHTAAADVGADVLGVRAHFLGHGFHHDEPELPAYDAADPTHWFKAVVDPNLRGAHEVRRLVWEAVQGTRIDAVPEGLPVSGAAGLPAVADGHWAISVVGSAVTPNLGTSFPNVALDPQASLGPPEGDLAGLVAVGITGAWLAVELGAAAIDGPGDDLVVLEFGVASGGTPEPYRVFASEESEGPWTPIGDGLGERGFDLAGSGLDTARYVRVESLVPEAEILAGQGSPYYPGPELDAIGAANVATP
jgi:hypothetical protein